MSSPCLVGSLLGCTLPLLVIGFAVISILEMERQRTENERAARYGLTYGQGFGGVGVGGGFALNASAGCRLCGSALDARLKLCNCRVLCGECAELLLERRRPRCPCCAGDVESVAMIR